MRTARQRVHLRLALRGTHHMFFATSAAAAPHLFAARSARTCSAGLKRRGGAARTALASLVRLKRKSLWQKRDGEIYLKRIYVTHAYVPLSPILCLFLILSAIAPCLTYPAYESLLCLVRSL